MDTAGAPPVNYTIFADAGLSSIDVEHHTSDFERRIFPLQWAVDQVCLISFCRRIVAERPYHRLSSNCRLEFRNKLPWSGLIRT